MIALGHFDDVDKLEKEIDLYVENTKDSPSIGFIGFSSLSTPAKWISYEHILNKYKPKAVQFFAPSIVTQENRKSNVQLAHEYGVKFIGQVGTYKEAKQCIEHNVDAIICQGSEGGGHGVHRNLGNSTIALSSQISNMVDRSIPIIAAGGIVTGKQLASALCVCDGVSIGTRYWASKESLGNLKLQQELIKNNSCDDVVRTTVFDAVQNELSINKWPYPYNSVGALQNETTSKWDGRPEDLQLAINNTKLLDEYKLSQKASDTTVLPTLSGEGIGEINSIEGAYDITLRIETEAADTIKTMQQIIS